MAAEHRRLVRRTLTGAVLAGLLLGICGTLPANADEDLCLGIDADGDGVIDQLPPPSGCIVVPFAVEPEKNNTIDLAFHTIHVAVLWTPTFDYKRINDVPLCFGDADTPSNRACLPVTGKSKFRDVNGDGRDDRVWKWPTGETGVEPGDTSACIYGTTSDGAKIEACDHATVINGTGPALYVDNVSVTEGNAGLKPATFTVTLTPASAEQVTVNYATADYSATAPADYQSTSGQLTFAPGETSKTVTVYVVGDTAVEPNESYSLYLSSAVGAAIGDVRGSGAITNDDSVANPMASIGDVSVVEGNSGTTTALFTVSISPPASQPVAVSWATADGTAAAPEDYQAGAGTLSFASGEASKTVNVSVVGDLTVEPSEVFYVDISSADVGIADSRGAGTITNDDSPPPAPMASINDVTVTEGNSGTTTASFTVSISPPASQPVAVSWTTADGTAVAPGDYQSGAGTLSFASGEASKTVDVLVVGDVSDESSEVYYVDISSTDVGISDSRGAGTITNDDTQSLPSISISDVTMAEGNGGSQAAVFVVTLSAPSANQVTVGYATADGKARTPSDYQGVTGSLVYAPGEVSKTISVTVYGDTLSEREENFFVNLSGASGATIADAQGKCLIQNDDG